MTKPALAIMAAGMGSRYGGLKQIDPVGPHNELIIDYSIYDALKAGFGKVVFIIKEEIRETFREMVGRRVESLVDTAYVYQRTDDLPEGFHVPEGRTKPWGTGHAVLSCRSAVSTPFAVINADDFYGQASFRVLYDYLKDLKDAGGIYQYGMVGFLLENTLTEHGHVARGICSVDSSGYLSGIRERTKIVKSGKDSKYTEDEKNWFAIPKGSTVSMNTWGFTPSIFNELQIQFPEFLNKNRENISKAEFFLPEAIDRLISANKARVKVLASNERWYGVTYKEDKLFVKEAIAGMIKQGTYPADLWEGWR